MKRTGIMAALTAGGLIIGTLLLMPSSFSETRVVRVQGTCPDECDVGAFPRGNHCECMTTAKSVPGEISRPDDIPLADQKRLVLRCGHTDPETGIVSDVVREEPVTTPPGTGIILVPIVEIGSSFHNVETATTQKLRQLCAPCPVEPGSWGRCPRCLCPGRSCADECEDRL